MPTLTVWHYDTPLGAEAGEVRLKALQERGSLTVHDAVTVAWMPGAHEPHVGHFRHATSGAAGKGSVLGALVGMLVLAPAAGAAAGAGVAAVAQRLRGTGIDQDFLEDVTAHLAPGTSAMLVLSSDADLDGRACGDRARVGQGRRRTAPRRRRPSTVPYCYIRQRLRARLPEFLVPETIVEIERLPLLPSGKLDRRGLAAHAKAPAAPREAVPAAPPRNDDGARRRAHLAGAAADLGDVGSERTSSTTAGIRCCCCACRTASAGGASASTSRSPISSVIPPWRSLAERISSPRATAPATRPRRRGSARMRRLSARRRPGGLVTRAHRRHRHGRPLPRRARRRRVLAEPARRRRVDPLLRDEELRAAGVDAALLPDPRYVRAKGVLDDVDALRRRRSSASRRARPR